MAIEKNIYNLMRKPHDECYTKYSDALELATYLSNNNVIAKDAKI